MGRSATVSRKTRETQIELSLSLDGPESLQYENATGIGFFDHMLDHLARHGRLGLRVRAQGDQRVDDHHTVEDVGIVLGQALDKALGDKKGIRRFGFASVPMDEALARVSIDLSGRPALVFRAEAGGFGAAAAKIGQFDTQLVREFLQAFVNHGKFNCHVEVPHGENYHHIAEAIFKALGLALRQAIEIEGQDVPSTKGVL